MGQIEIHWVCLVAAAAAAAAGVVGQQQHVVEHTAGNVVGTAVEGMLQEGADVEDTRLVFAVAAVVGGTLGAGQEEDPQQQLVVPWVADDTLDEDVEDVHAAAVTVADSAAGVDPEQVQNRMDFVPAVAQSDRNHTEQQLPLVG